MHRQPPLSTDTPVILVTGFLGIPSTEVSALRNEQVRFDATCSALRSLRASCRNLRIFLAFTGSAESLQRLILECNWKSEDAICFAQAPELFPFGKGLLEHQLVKKALNHWGLAHTDTKVLKITAKYIVENIEDIVNFVKRSSLPLFGWMHLGKSMIDTRCFFFQAKVYGAILATLDSIDDRKGYFMEHAVYDALLQLGIRPGLVRHRPLLTGMSGSSGVVMTPAPWKRMIVSLASLSGCSS
jgi:hypothetical protein